MNKSRNEKVFNLIFDTYAHAKDRYKSIVYYCIEELSEYGIDITNPLGPQEFDEESSNWQNLSVAEMMRCNILIRVYNFCFKLIKSRAVLLHPERTYEENTCNFAYNSGATGGSFLTYMLMLSNNVTLTESDYINVVNKLDKFNDDRRRGGKNKAETRAKEISRQKARERKAKNKHLTKPDLVQGIIEDMNLNKNDYELKRDIPSFDTISGWLTNLYKE